MGATLNDAAAAAGRLSAEGCELPWLDQRHLEHHVDAAGVLHLAAGCRGIRGGLCATRSATLAAADGDWCRLCGHERDIENHVAVAAWLWTYPQNLSRTAGEPVTAADAALARRAEVHATCMLASDTAADISLATVARQAADAARGQLDRVDERTLVRTCRTAANMVCADRTEGLLELVAGQHAATRARTAWDDQLVEHGNTASATAAVAALLEASTHPPVSATDTAAVLDRWASTWNQALHTPGWVLLHDESIRRVPGWAIVDWRHHWSVATHDHGALLAPWPRHTRAGAALQVLMCVPQVVADAWAGRSTHNVTWHTVERPLREPQLAVVATLVADGWPIDDAAHAAATLER